MKDTYDRKKRRRETEKDFGDELSKK